LQTVDKAMHVLGFFSVGQPEIGLSDLTRLAGFDKAATHRFLVALSKHGFIEQNPDNKKYRLGPGFLKLARIRETMFPASKLTQPLVDWLTAETGETAHASVLGNGSLTTATFSEPVRGSIVHIDPGESVPFHATASGLVFLGFSAMDQREQYISRPLPKLTSGTVTDESKLTRLIKRAQKNGYCISANGIEDGVTGLAVPYFTSDATVAGTLAIAAPNSRLSSERSSELVNLLFQASDRATHGLGGVTPSEFPASN